MIQITNYFADGIEDSVKKIAYAASFGVSEWEFSSEQTKRCSMLLKKFSYVSVREESGIDLVKNYLGRNSEVYWDLDPTLLINFDYYLRFITPRSSNQSYIFSYILDFNEQKQSVSNLVSQMLNKQILIFNTNAENPLKPINQRIAPKVEDWLNGIYHSKFVITDSFHGTIFAIVFNKPFVVYVNNIRGAERFKSLLNMLGLTNRMLHSAKDLSKEIIEENIDWNLVN